jgi:hypothetical protein
MEYKKIRKHRQSHIIMSENYAEEYCASTWVRDNYPHARNHQIEIAAAKLCEWDWYHIMLANHMETDPPDCSIGGWDSGHDLHDTNIKCAIRNKRQYYINGKPDNYEMAWPMYASILPGQLVLYATDAGLTHSLVVYHGHTSDILHLLKPGPRLYRGKKLLHAADLGIDWHHLDDQLLRLAD